MAQVFISYSKRDPQAAQLFASGFGVAGLSSWYDVEIEANAEWRKKIESELDAAGCVVVLWSANSVKSRFVVSEGERADRSGKLVQVAIQRVRPPIGFDETQHLDLVNWQGRVSDPRWQRLVGTVNNVLRGEPASNATAAAAAAQGGRAANAWRHVSESLDPSDYRSFIDNHPQDALARLAQERLKDLEAWARVNKKDPAAIKAFILTGPFEKLVETARAAIGDAERYQAGVFVDEIARQVAQQVKSKNEAEQERQRAQAAEKAERDRQKALAAEAADARARRSSFVVTLIMISPFLLIAAISLAVQAEHALKHASFVSDWGVNLHADADQRVALNVVERFVVDVLARVTWNWVVVGVSFGEALYGFAACCLGALCWWVVAFDADLIAEDRSSRVGNGCAALPLIAGVLYLVAAIVPALLTVALFIFVGWLLLLFLAIWSIV